MNNKNNIAILFFTLIVVMLGFGMIIPILPFYIQSMGASGSELGMLMAIYGAMQFVFAPVWGSISDRIGRKPVLMIGVLGNAISQLIFGFSTELWMLFVARALTGILSSATLPSAMAYVGDSTSKDERGGKMGLIGAAMGIGMVIGPGLGGWLAGSSLSLPFFIASALSFIALVLIFLVLPESSRPVDAGAAISRGPQFKNLWLALVGPLGVLFLMAFLLSFGLTNFESIFGLYTALRYQYTPQQVGGLLTIIGLLSAIIQGVLTGVMTRRIGEVNVIRGALVLTAIGFYLMTLAASLPQVLLSVGFFVVSHAMLNPAVSSLISKRTSSGQGMAMGLNNAFQSLGRIAGPLWAGIVFDINMNFPYFTGALIMLSGFGLGVLGLRDEKPDAESAVTASEIPSG
jgi:DHA1 family multidrug resistance protein-like MFS transporter